MNCQPFGLEFFSRRPECAGDRHLWRLGFGQRAGSGDSLEIGEGRVLVLGKAGMLSAQRDRRGSPVEMNFPGYNN
jgi:hypothetical protein